MQSLRGLNVAALINLRTQIDERLVELRTELEKQLAALTGKAPAALARLHQRDRKPDGRAATGLQQRQTLARCADGVAMDWNRNAGGREELSPFEGPQAAPGSDSPVAATSPTLPPRPTPCQQTPPPIP